MPKHLALLVGPALLWLTACSAAPQRYEFTAPKMGTTVGLVLYASDSASARAAADAAFARIDQLNHILSDYEEDSEINQLSRTSGSGKWVSVSDDLFLVLSRSQEISQLTGGAFDITAGPMIRLWRRARRTGQLPDPALMKSAMASSGYQHMHLDAKNQAVKLDAAGMHLDVGGIAKGYTASEVLKVLRIGGITRALVSMAGDIGAGDPPPGQEGWRVSLDPMLGQRGTGKSDRGADENAPSSEIGYPRSHRSVILRNMFISTAGDAYQHVTINGTRYSHIIDPKTGMGLTEPLAVTAISTDGAFADGIDDGLAVMGLDRALPLAEQLPGTAVIFYRLKPDGSLETIMTSRAKKLTFVNN
jgi:thiamine biosynthesis lipoprotein